VPARSSGPIHRRRDLIPHQAAAIRLHRAPTQHLAGVTRPPAAAIQRRRAPTLRRAGVTPLQAEVPAAEVTAEAEVALAEVAAAAALAAAEAARLPAAITKF
jgi:hypothetical protein